MASVPSQLNISMEPLSDNFSRLTVDLVVLIRMAQASKQFRCEVSRDNLVDWKHAREEDIDYADGDSAVANDVIRHDNRRWVEDIGNGNIESILMCRGGWSNSAEESTGEYIKLYFKDGEPHEDIDPDSSSRYSEVADLRSLANRDLNIYICTPGINEYVSVEQLF